jgi:transposase
MGRALALRGDFTAADLKRLARESRDAGQTRRLLALAVIYDGESRAAAAETGGVGRQIVRDWVERFNAEAPDGLVSRKPPGNPSKLNDAHRTELVRIVERGPIPATDGVVRWRLVDLAAWVWDAFGISVSEATLSRELKALGYSKLSARPRHHARDTRSGSPLSKDFPARLAEIRDALPPGTGIELWFADEARVGQKNKITRRWAKRGTRPSAPHDQRTQSAYIFGAICPKKGKGAGLVMPRCDTDAMTAHLAEISAAVDPGAHAVVRREIDPLDQFLILLTPRPGRLAHVEGARRPRQHHPHAAAAAISGAEPR